METTKDSLESDFSSYVDSCEESSREDAFV